jgi:hypothetical protein
MPVGPLVVPQVLALGDVGLSILSLTGDTQRPFMSRSAFLPDFKEKIVYFHRNTVPQKWGLRDGRWKFIARRVGTPQPELSDLVSDPDEKRTWHSNTRIGWWSTRIWWPSVTFN